ncbi:MAG: 50S ribosomal protein L3 [Candidatus Hodgkinia cicadicola]|nr:MAG: 50S ribosomal protein L3 [Candidatus Hodgkinia cicadicola]
MATLDSEAATVLEVVACVVTSVLESGFEFGYNTAIGAGGFVLISVCDHFRLCCCLPNEFGSVLVADWLANVPRVNAQAVCKGKGFTGVVKRHGFSGLRASHGVSLAHRACGAIGARQDPGRVWKGKKMAGRMGGTKTTVKNLRVARYNAFSCRVIVYGSVPGGTRLESVGISC